ncbi:hypothetical protein [Spirillospora sp. NPDC047279]|uniref:hypothetical protein n=1 Tax=Spirillospora sp. NPDC047279 TaxID=3155478 RepID=UPI0033DBBC3E
MRAGWRRTIRSSTFFCPGRTPSRAAAAGGIMALVWLRSMHVSLAYRVYLASRVTASAG